MGYGEDNKIFTLADAVVYFRGDDTKLKSDLDKAETKTRSAMGNIANTAKGIAIGVAGAAVGALGAITGIAISGIGAASDLGESLSKVKVVFGENADAIEEWSKTSATALGQSQQEALEAVGTFGNLFDAMGIGKQNTKDMSISLVELASDLASFNNLNPTEALDKLRAGIVGETEPLRALGVNLNAAAVEMRALEMSGKAAKEELTESEKVAARFTLILEQTTNAQGDFARTSGGLANQQRILNAQWTDLKATLGQALLPAITSVITAFNGFMTDLGPKLKTFLETTVPGFLVTLRTKWDIDWGGMKTTITEFATAVPTALTGMWDAIDVVMGSNQVTTKSGWERFWGGLTTFFTGWILATLDSWTEFWLSVDSLDDARQAAIRGDWEAFWTGLGGFAEHTMNQFLNWIEFVFGPGLRNRIVNALNELAEDFRQQTQALLDIWNNTLGRLLPGVGGIPALPPAPSLAVVNPGNVTNNSTPVTINVNGGGGDPYYTGREVGNGFLDAMRQAGG